LYKKQGWPQFLENDKPATKYWYFELSRATLLKAQTPHKGACERIGLYVKLIALLRVCFAGGKLPYFLHLRSWPVSEDETISAKVALLYL
jgi:hypothetical protein